MGNFKENEEVYDELLHIFGKVQRVNGNIVEILVKDKEGEYIYLIPESRLKSKLGDKEKSSSKDKGRAKDENSRGGFSDSN